VDAFVDVLSGISRTKRFAVAPPRAVIGRAPDAAVRLSDGEVSRTHCAIENEDGAWWLRDLDSANGTYLNGKRIERAALADGDVICAGEVTFRFRLGAGAPRQAGLVSMMDAVTTGRRIEKRLDASSILEGPAEAADRVHRDLATVYRVTSLIHAESDTDRLLPLVMDAILEVVPADRAFLLLLDADGRPAPVVGRDRTSDRRPAEAPGLSRTIVSECIEKGLSILSDNAMLDGRFRETDSIVSQHITSAMCAPLESRGEILGAIYVDTVGKANAFDESQLELLGAIAHQAGVAIERARLLDEIAERLYETVQTLVAAIEAEDPYTHGHSERVMRYALAVGHAMRLSDEELQHLRMASLLHDIGKIGVRDDVLNKPAGLTEEERALFDKHPGIGAGILGHIRKVDPVVQAVLHHHERWDGAGYPDKLAGERIPLLARIIHVADAYDAMTTDRPYRARAPESKAVAELRDRAGVDFAPAVVDAFLQCYRKGLLPAPPAGEGGGEDAASAEQK
jgi:HD-GYP domain-containing protein (c-di-GMP phosphodiesterase class II)